MCISQIERATLYLTKNIYIKNIYVPNLIRNKVIKYHRVSDERKIFLVELNPKEKKEIVKLNFITY
uniref:Uncharacterized protein n=1 Tax=Mimiviridae sp. ChoanoV1 TaxID=2596887 RepID=A0A5B8IQE1_9VIRU|nr:hypothetical protein 7_49 [Mimiviridae sp. ChoanoV1]